MVQKELINKEKVTARMQDINEALRKLNKYQGMDSDEFLADMDNFYLASYWLRIAIEAVLTISIHILSRLPANGHKKDYTEVILSLADYGIISKGFAKKIKGMAGYRNRLVHMYWKIEPKELFNILKEDIDDFTEFIDYIKKFIK